ncbi:MAG: L-ribulose-5-phosphate 4-epimerase [Phycisphaerae bacterium]|jgi:L-ribulose-5-phosphate 4-epimerase
MLNELKKAVCEANLSLADSGLVIDTWGNVSGIDADRRNVVIKPSGVPYKGMEPRHMVVVSLADGKVVEGDLKPSSDTATHLEIYRNFAGVGGVVHTHSLFATAWAQAQRAIPVLGTTHADYFNGPVPCTREMTADEIDRDYEANTGKVIIERFRSLNPLHLPGVLVAGHGPFAWGQSAAQAVHNAIILEHLAQLASCTLALAANATPIADALLNKHFGRKHGPGSYYGQK